MCFMQTESVLQTKNRSKPTKKKKKQFSVALQCALPTELSDRYLPLDRILPCRVCSTRSKFLENITCPKYAEGMANRVDPDQTAHAYLQR